MNLKNCWVLLLLSLNIVSCSDGKNPRYKDTSHLEMPPKMEIVETAKQIDEEKDGETDTGLGNIVSLAGSTENPIIKIKKNFDRSWLIVEKAIKLNELEITDKNRDLGVYYVKFDPDDQASGDSSIIDSMTFFIFADEYDEATYKLSLNWRDSDTEVSAEVVDRESSSLLDDDEDIEDFEGSVDAGEKLLKTLFITIRDDLPIN
jgi:uncharacterized lipoprotein